MTKLISLAVLSAVLLLAAAVGGQDMDMDGEELPKCPCEEETDVICNTVTPRADGLCNVRSSSCSKCVCVTGGTKECAIDSAEVYVITNPINSECAVETVEYAFCLPAGNSSGDNAEDSLPAPAP